MKVRVKSQEQAPVQSPPLDNRMRLDAGTVGNRMHLMKNSGIPLSEFFTFLPLICYSCQRERTPEQLHVGVDMFIRCLDRDDCQQHWPGRRKEEPPPVEKPAHKKTKHKYRVKGA